jgi:hypothetical protein
MMTKQLLRRGALLSLFGVAGLAMVGACSSQVALGPEAIAGKTPDGTVELREVQVAYIGSGSTGGGVLHYRGRSHPFNVSGLGVGGVGASTITATGEIYNLPELSRFPGTYGQARYGFAVGRMSGGEMWLQNREGVIMHLKAERKGLMLSLGGDAMIVSMR